MKRLATYLFIVLGLGLAFSVNANSKIYCVDEKIGERIENLKKVILKEKMNFLYIKNKRCVVHDFLY